MKFEMDLPEEIINIIRADDKIQEFERNALLIYPYIFMGDISLRKAAELLNTKFEILSKYYKSKNFTIYDFNENGDNGI